ncbi:MAG: esterase [Microbacterium sp.]|nr:MAG: esterase [Microbacterium sp.]
MSEIPPLDADAVIWSTPPAERAGRPLLVLLHGYGADERDLFGLAPYLPETFVVASVRAPLAPPFPTPGWSWYPLQGPVTRDSAAITGAAERLLQWLDESTDAAHVGLLGFSQGAAVALQAMRLRPQRFAFAVNLAGFVDATPLPLDEELAERRPPVFWGRGANDEVIPADRVAHTVQWLPEHVDLSGRVYPGLTHSVSQDELDDVVVFLHKRREELEGA